MPTYKEVHTSPRHANCFHIGATVDTSSAQRGRDSCCSCPALFQCATLSLTAAPDTGRCFSIARIYLNLILKIRCRLLCYTCLFTSALTGDSVAGFCVPTWRIAFFGSFTAILEFGGAIRVDIIKDVSSSNANTSALGFIDLVGRTVSCFLQTTSDISVTSPMCSSNNDLVPFAHLKFLTANSCKCTVNSQVFCQLNVGTIPIGV